MSDVARKAQDCASIDRLRTALQLIDTRLALLGRVSSGDTLNAVLSMRNMARAALSETGKDQP